MFLGGVEVDPKQYWREGWRGYALQIIYL